MGPSLKTLLLPGLDGNATLFRSFQQFLAKDLSIQALALPEEGEQDPISLMDRLSSRIDWEDSLVLVAESFSGPLAYQLYLRNRTNIKAMIFVASFLSRPNPLLSLAKILPLRCFPLQRPPAFALRRFCLGLQCPQEVVSEVQAAISQTPQETLARRLLALNSLPLPQEKIEVPCLLLQANRDLLISKRTQKTFEQVCRSLKVRNVDGPHFLLQANPQEAAREISEFLASLSNR